jgi:hypothetical protein
MGGRREGSHRLFHRFPRHLRVAIQGARVSIGTMCRLLGIVASEPTEFRLALREAPRSLAALSREHRDGWGLAVWDDAERLAPRQGDRLRSRGRALPRARRGRGELLVAHIRQRTVGCSSLENTHPFQSGRWVFAHNGTIKDVEFLRAKTSASRNGGDPRTDRQRAVLRVRPHPPRRRLGSPTRSRGGDGSRRARRRSRGASARRLRCVQLPPLELDLHLRASLRAVAVPPRARPGRRCA